MLIASNKKDKIYSRILLYLAVITSFTIFIVSTILYINFERIGLNLIHSFIKDTLTQISYSATFMTDSAKTLTTQIYFDNVISNLFFRFPPDEGDTKKGLIRLSSFNASTPFVHSIYIYNKDTNTFYTDSSHVQKYDWTTFTDPWVKDALEHPEAYKTLVPIPRKILPPYSKEGDTNYSFVYTYMLSSARGFVSKTENAVILNISEEWMKKITDSLDVNPGSNTFILDGQGNVVSSNKKYAMLSNIYNQKYIPQILKSDKSSGFFIERIDGMETLVTYVSSDSIGWKFVRLTPYNTIAGKINGLKNTTLLIGIIILLVGFLFSFLLSRRLYSPINRIIDRLKFLEEESRNNFYPLKQEFLRNLLLNKTGYTQDSLQKKFKEFNINLDITNPVQLLLLKIDNYADFCNKHNVNDRSLFRYAIINIATELCSQKNTNEGVDMGEDHVILLFNSLPDDTQEHCQEIEELTKSIQTSVKKYLDIDLSAAVSTTAESVEESSYQYHEVLETSRCFIFHGHGCILHSDAVNLARSHEYTYPLQKEKLLIDALMLEKATEVKKYYIEIIDEVRGCSYTTFQLTLMRLAVAISMAADSIEKNSGFSVSYDFMDFTSKINLLETVNDIHEHFFKMFDYLSHKLEERKNPKYNDMILKIYEIVEQNYADTNLSRESIAEQVGLSPVYLGRLFLKLTSHSIVEYLNEVRLKKAKELLTSTSNPITDISVQVGFTSPNYFHSLFKKKHGVTPNEFRQNVVNIITP